MSVRSSDSENYEFEEGEIVELNKSYFTLYFTDHCTETFILFDDNRFTVYGSKRNNVDGECTHFYAQYFICQIESLITFLFFIFNRFDTAFKLALYTVELDKHSLSDYGFDFIYNKCGDNECLNLYSSATYNRMNTKRLYDLLEMIQQ
jgi:hypothetical protein